MCIILKVDNGNDPLSLNIIILALHTDCVVVLDQ